MTLQRIRYFVTVAQKLNFSRAAEQHYVSQTAISQQIRLLEGELGVQLLERSNRSVQLTPAGRAYYEEAIKILELTELAAQKARHAAVSGAQELKVGIMYGLENSAFVDTLLCFRQQEPSVSFQFQLSSLDDAMREVLQGHTDLALTLKIFPLYQKSFCQTELAVIQNFAVLNRQSSLARYNVLEHQQLCAEQLYVPSLSAGYWALLAQNMAASGLDTGSAIFVETLEALVLQIAFHGGYAVLAEPILQSLPRNPNLIFIPLAEDFLPLCAVWSHENPNPALQKLLRYAGMQNDG